MKTKTLTLVVIVILLALLAPACKSRRAQTEPVPTPAPTPAPTPTPAPKVEVKEPKLPKEEPVQQPVDLSAEEVNRSGVLRTVYFDFDKFDLSAEARSTLRSNADWLKQHSRWNVVIEGHCDERGTIEYNIELGQKRARAVRDFLSSLGVSGSRLRTVSYGEERPAELGHSEMAWAKNRRAEFKVE